MTSVFQKQIVLASLFFLVLFTACNPNVEDILEKPSKYANKKVELEGKVTKSNGIFGAGYFIIDDGTGEIPVLTSKGLPNEGEEVTVKGKVSQMLKIEGLQVVGIMETERD
jgi:hypothetical protein